MPKLKLLGVGGGGGNAINSMMNDTGIRGVEFVSINTDSQAFLANQASTKLQIGENITKGLGSGADPELADRLPKNRVKKSTSWYMIPI